jgi:hypothetical protein
MDLQAGVRDSSRCGIIHDMSDECCGEAQSKQVTDVDRDRIIQALSLEYQSLREEINVRTSGRFQFLGLTTTAAALLTTGAFGSSVFGSQRWIPDLLALLVFVFGLISFIVVGIGRKACSKKVAATEKRINALIPAEPGFTSVLSWESDHQNPGPLSMFSTSVRTTRERKARPGDS